MRMPRTRTDAIARFLGVIGLVLVVGAGGIEVARWASPARAGAAGSVSRDQAAPEATEAAQTDTPAQVLAEPSATDASAGATAEPTATDVPADATDVPAATGTPPDATNMPAATDTPPDATDVPAAPTAEPSAVPTAVPTAAGGLLPSEPAPFIGDAPLRLSKIASVPRAAPGETFSYSLELVSRSTGAVEVRDFIDQQLDVVDASVTGGTCRIGNPVVCTLNVTQGRAATIAVTVRAHADAPLGAPTVSQALAQDDKSFTASSEPVVVQIAAQSQAVQAQASSPTPIITEEEDDPAPTPTATSAAGAQTVTPLVSEEDDLGASPTALVSEEDDVQTTPAAVTPLVSEEDDLGATPTALVSEEGGAGYPPPVAQQPRSTAVPAATPAIRPPTRPAQAVVPLPNTAVTGPTAGVGVALLGFALILHGTRRVHGQHNTLGDQLAAFRRLRPVGRTIAHLQRSTAEAAAEMDERARRMADLLDDRGEPRG